MNDETKVLLETIQRLTEQRRDLLEAIDVHRSDTALGMSSQADRKLWGRADQVKELCKKEPKHAHTA